MPRRDSSAAITSSGFSRPGSGRLANSTGRLTCSLDLTSPRSQSARQEIPSAAPSSSRGLLPESGSQAIVAAIDDGPDRISSCERLYRDFPGARSLSLTWLPDPSVRRGCGDADYLLVALASQEVLCGGPPRWLPDRTAWR